MLVHEELMRKMNSLCIFFYLMVAMPSFFLSNVQGNNNLFWNEISRERNYAWWIFKSISFTTSITRFFCFSREEGRSEWKSRSWRYMLSWWKLHGYHVLRWRVQMQHNLVVYSYHCFANNHVFDDHVL